MPIKLEFRKSGVIFWGSGVVTGEEVLSANREVYTHPFEEPLTYQIAINSRVTDFLVSPEEMRALAAMDIELAATQPQVVITVAESDYLYGMARMWSGHADSETFNTHVVRSVEQAQQILSDNGIEVSDLSYP